jgi:hypothetical protein
MGAFSRSFGDWARAVQQDDAEEIIEAFDAMNAAPKRYQVGWDGVDDFALQYSGLLDAARAGIRQARNQLATAQTPGESTIATVHLDGWTALEASLVNFATAAF